MSSPLFNVTIQPSSLPGQTLYPKLATVKLQDPQLQPVVERKGCEKILAGMRDCLVETHSWEKCEGQVIKFQECINTRYFEDKDEKIELEKNAMKDDEVNSEKEQDQDVTVEEGNENDCIDQLATIPNDDVGTSEDLAENNNREDEASEEKHEAVENSDNLDEKGEEIGEEPLIDENKPTEDENEATEESDLVEDNEDESGDKDSFRVKIVSKKDENVEWDENLLFKVSVIKPTTQTKASKVDEETEPDKSEEKKTDETEKAETIPFEEAKTDENVNLEIIPTEETKTDETEKAGTIQTEETKTDETVKAETIPTEETKTDQTEKVENIPTEEEKTIEN